MVHSHWFRSRKAWLSLVSLISYAIKNQLRYLGISLLLTGSIWDKRVGISNTLKIFQHFEVLDQ